MRNVIGGIGPIRPIVFLLPLGQARGGELFAVAAFLNKAFFGCGNLLVRQVICLVNQADRRVGAHGRIVVLKPGRVQRPALLIGEVLDVARIRRIGPIGRRPICYLFG